MDAVYVNGGEVAASNGMAQAQHVLNWNPKQLDIKTKSVEKTGKLVVSHEAPVSSGFGAEVVATIQSNCFYMLESPIRRVSGYDTPFPLIFEKHYIPDKLKNYEAIKEAHFDSSGKH